MFIAQEATKFGMDAQMCAHILDQQSKGKWPNIKIDGLMGMASLTSDQDQIKREFMGLKNLFDANKQRYGLSVLSMGMSSDYVLAIACGSNLIRVGSKIFE